MKHAVTLDTYGFDPYTVKVGYEESVFQTATWIQDNKTGNMVYVGMNYGGVLVYHLNRKLHQMPWWVIKKTTSNTTRNLQETSGKDWLFRQRIAYLSDKWLFTCGPNSRTTGRV